MCVNSSRGQFPEVVYLVLSESNGIDQTCSGTVISPNWILTAAHCIIEKESTASLAGAHKDYEYPHPEKMEVQAVNALSIPTAERIRHAERVITWSGYTGSGDNDTFPPNGDLALVRIKDPFPAASVPPDQVAVSSQFSPISTSGGYGLANTAAGIVDDEFNISWPPDLTGPTAGHPSPDFLQFAMTGDKAHSTNGAFCLGDSGGPVFVGRNRGCRPMDKPEGEARPRVVQGINSWFSPGKSKPGDAKDKGWIDICLSSKNMSVDSVMEPVRHAWICNTAEQSPAGCK